MVVVAGFVDLDLDRRLAEVEFVTCAYSLEEAWCDTGTTSMNTTNSADDGVQEDIQIHRRLDLTIPNNMNDNTENGDVVIAVPVCLTLTLPPSYPTSSALRISGRVIVLAGDKPTGNSANNNMNTNDLLKLQKVVYATLPQMVHSCRDLAMENIGEEAVFLVLHHAEEWIQTEWPGLYREQQQQQPQGAAASQIKINVHNDDHYLVSSRNPRPPPLPPSSLVLGRRLIFSHHIISKIKRRDIHDLVKHHRLTGYMKIGWPGILLIEGAEEDCIAFYDTIRPWQWQYLVVRGEQQDTVPSSSRGNHDDDDDDDDGGDVLDRYRKFQTFQEVEDLSQVAQHCREVGLEALFQTSMKNFKNETDNNHNNNTQRKPSCWYGALVRVDHMNHGKAYRKWLRKTSQETDCYLLIKEYCPSSLSSSCVGGTNAMTTTMSSSTSEQSQEEVKNDNHFKYSSSCSSSSSSSGSRDNNNNKTSKKKTHRFSYSIIVIGIRAKDSKNVSNFLKRWRTSRVDIDATGKPCLERQMSILVEGSLTLFHDATTTATNGNGGATTTTSCDDNDNNTIQNTSTRSRNDTLLAAALEQEVRVSSLEELVASVLFMGGETWQAAISLQGQLL
jgi:hypothetical protein